MANKVGNLIVNFKRKQRSILSLLTRQVLSTCRPTLCFLFLFLFISSAYADLVSIAQSEIGNGEQYGNNKGVYVRQYLNGQENLPWCAGFVSWCLNKSGADIPYTLRAKDFIKYGRCVCINELKRGDLVVFTRQGGGHIGIIEKVNKNNFISIEGNVGKYPATVKRITHKFYEKSIYRFVRIV